MVGEDRETTIIDGNQAGSVVTFDNDEVATVLLRSFTIQNGLSQFGGGILMLSAASLLDNLIIKNNFAICQGGGIGCDNGSTPRIMNTDIINNTVIEGSDGGGGIYLHLQSHAVLENVFISNNVAAGQGGGIFIII